MRAYISTFNKENIEILAKNLINKNYEIVSTGNSANYLIEHGIKVTKSETITGFNELLGGKVKSLHPDIFAGLLADEEERKAFNINGFDLIAIDLYPFEEYKSIAIKSKPLILKA